jgi:SAM-dependent methyltransferase
MGCEADGSPVLTGFDRHHGVGGRFGILECPDCGLRWTSPRPTAETIGAYYPDDYTPYLRTAPPADAGPVTPGLKGAIQRLADPRSEWIPPLAPGRAIEVGCSSGTFLRSLRQRGWEVAGIEPSATAAELARRDGIPVHVGPLESAPDPGPAGSFDLIVAWMVFEHLHDPRGALGRFRDWVGPGGWLALSVPDAGAVEARVFGDAWLALDVPRHLTHFTPSTLAAMLDAEGWILRRRLHQRTLSNAVASLGYALEDRGARRAGGRLLGAVDRGGRWVYAAAPAAALAAAAGQTGRITVWAQAR